MEFYQFKSKYQKSLQSMFSFTKKWTLVNNKKQVLNSVNHLTNYLEYFIFNCKFFFFSLKRNYFYELVPFQKITNIFTQSSILFFFNKVKNSRNTILLFLNIPFFISIIISEIFESVRKKTIYLYRFFLFLSIPVIIYFVNQNILLQNNKDYLLFLLPDNKKIFLSGSGDSRIGSTAHYQNGKDYFYLQNLRKIFLRDHIFNFLSKKRKSFDLQKQNSSFFFEKQGTKYTDRFAPNFHFDNLTILAKTTSVAQEGTKYNNKKSSLLNQSALNNIKTTDEKTKYISPQSITISNWLLTYIKLKKNHLIKYAPRLNPKKEFKILSQGPAKTDLREIANENSKLQSFKLFKLTPHCTGFLFKKNSYFKQQFLQKIDSFFFSLIQPRDLNYLRNLAPLKVLSQKNSVLFDILELQNKQLNKRSFLKCETSWYTQRSNKAANLAPSINKKQWIQQWMNCFAPSEARSILLLKKNTKLKEDLHFFQNFQFVIQSLKRLASGLWTPLGQIYFEKSLFNRTRDLHIGHSLFLNNPNQSVFQSYKNSFKVEQYAPSGFSERFIFQKNEYCANAPQKINLLYNFSCHSHNDYLFINPERFFLIQHAEKKMLPTLKPFPQITDEGDLITKQNNQKFLMIKPLYDLYDLDFYLKKADYVPHEYFFNYSPSSLVSLLDLKNPLTDLTILEPEEKNQKQKNILSNFGQKSRLTSLQQDYQLIKKKRTRLQNIIHSTKLNLFQKYNSWIFTPQWWSFRKQGIFTEIQSLVEDLTNNVQVLLYRFSTKLDYANQKYLLSHRRWALVSNIFFFQFQSWNKLLVERIYTSQHEQPLWRNLKLLLSVNNSSWSFFAWFFTSSIVYYHWFPMFTGFIYLYLWLDFENIRSLANPSWKTFLSVLIHNSIDSPSQQLRLTGYLSRGRIFSIYSKFYKMYNEIFFVFNRFNYITTLDLSRRNKNLVSNSFITKKTLQSKYYFWNIKKKNIDGFISEEQGYFNGFHFFQKWYEKNCRISVFFQNNASKSFSLNWLNDLFFYNKIFSNGALAQEVRSTNLSNSNTLVSLNCKSKGCTPLLEPLPYMKRWLFIGSLESGKSFVIKNIAASCSAPVIHISIKDIKNATPDSKYTKIRKQKRWVEQLSERSFLLENIFHLAKILAPSIFWISDLHDFETKNQLQEKNTQKFDVSLLMATLLKILSIDLVPEKQNKITFIGSTEYPRLLDPKFVSRQRLDLIVNFRTPSFSQRQSIFSFLLQTKGFAIKGSNRSFYELNSNTLGYTFRDITSLVNETLLIKTTENTTSIDSNTIRLALYRQTSTQSVKYKTIRQENLQYKIGKALVQAILVYPKSIMLLSKYQDLWKTKFYYLSNTYLEVSNKKAITTEFVLLTQILSCLAGSAARDAWILSTKELFTEDKKPAALALTSQLKHDFSIASNILQALLVEFSMQDITSFAPKKKKDRKDISKTFSFHFIKRATSYLEFLDSYAPSYINWSIKVKRLSLNWILLFSRIEHSTKNLARLLFLDKSKKNIFSPILEKSEIHFNIPYERRETKRQQQKLQKIDSLFNKMLYTMYMENLGFPWESEYVMDYNPFQFSLFFRESRPLWNPQTIMPSYSILFFDRDLLINQKLLTKLYITYGNKFQIEKLNRKRIKKQSFWSNFALNKTDLNKISEIKKDFGNYQVLSHGSNWSDFHFYQNLINLNAQLDQSQMQLPVYLHQGWLTADPNESFRTFDILSTKILVHNAHSIYKESFLFEVLLEIYQYLLKFFILNKNVMVNLNEILIKNEILYRQDIEIMMKKENKIAPFATD